MFNKHFFLGIKKFGRARKQFGGTVPECPPWLRACCCGRRQLRTTEHARVRRLYMVYPKKRDVLSLGGCWLAADQVVAFRFQNAKIVPRFQLTGSITEIQGRLHSRFELATGGLFYQQLLALCILAPKPS